MEYLLPACGVIIGFGIGFFAGYKYGVYDSNASFIAHLIGPPKTKKTYDVKIIDK